MQPAPYRLSQALRSAFKAARPIHQPNTYWRSNTPRVHPVRCCPSTRTPLQFRFASDRRTDVDKKAEDAKKRIDDTIESRAEAVAGPDVKLKDPNDETIVHTNPEASSIVHKSSEDTSTASTPYTIFTESQTRNEALPSESSSRTSHLRRRFSHLMDNYQTYLFTASRRLNDLTGYTGIENLKKEIESQEQHVKDTRNLVKALRAEYQQTVATRSQTQREVNDLLQRKHAWTPDDLNRFTNLYQADHTNEQAEQAAEKDVAEAETKYEEASTTLARTILARYHEEQIWSDKIRQMSTWGTWGLMGLNVLLFIIFQIAIEPWRRRRLVRGFEEKVELALAERDEHIKTLSRGMGVQPNVGDPITPASAEPEDVADHIASAIVDAVSGTTEPPTYPDVEAVAESVVTNELANDPSHSGDGAFATATSGYAYYEEAFRELFSEKKITVTQREITTAALEGAAGGAAVMGLLFVLLRPR